MLCENCQKREATVFVKAIEGDVIKSRDLCSECHDSSSPEARDFSNARREGRCEYCGDQPCAGGTDIFAMMTGVQKMKFMCMLCSMEHNRFIQQHLQRDASGLSQHEQLDLLEKLDKEADVHMKQWVSKRGSQ
jgi:protein-arginine kinase activator protein McsA